MTTIYLAACGLATMRTTFQDWDWERYPIGILVSYAYPHMLNYAERLNLRPPSTMLDSGAYTAYTLGKEINIDALIEETKSDKWTYAVALDDLGSWEVSRTNAYYMREQSSPAYPVHHIGEPFELLREYCQEWDVVGLSITPQKMSDRKACLYYYRKAFEREYPHRFHSFGWVHRPTLEELPFWSADTSSWNSPATRGNWRCFKGAVTVKPEHLKNQPGTNVGKVGLQSEVFHYYNLQRFLQSRWRKEMERWQ